MNMKEKIYYLLFAVLMALFCTACNEEWTDEQYEHYVSFKAPMDYARGVTDIYVKYKLNGAVTYQLPVIMSGSTLPGHDTEVQIAIDSDTLKSINWEYFHNRTDLYYKELTSDYYEVENMNVVIPADDCVGLLNVNFKLGGIDLVDKWVLPLTIRESPIGSYTPHPRKNYKKALLRVVPFNDYSGSYTASSMKVYTYINGKPDTNARTTNKRTGYVIDNNSVFFYAGLINEDMDKDIRKKYKINVHFREDGTLDMKPDDPNNEMEFELIGTPIYSSTSIMDATRPYLERRYVQIMFEYDFQDFTYGGSGTEVIPIKYRVAGSMTLLRNINTQIPDEDQQIEW